MQTGGQEAASADVDLHPGEVMVYEAEETDLVSTIQNSFCGINPRASDLRCLMKVLSGCQ